MAERDTPQPETAEQLGQQLLEFVDKTKFGTPEFQAVNDYLDLRSLREQEGESPRINEIEIALLKRQIAQHKSQLPGYSRTFGRIERDFADLLTVSGLEAQQKFSESSEQDQYITQMCQVALNGVQEIVSMKRDIL
jgi:hypothetical protein